MISQFWKIQSLVSRKLSPIVSYDKDKLYARFLKDDEKEQYIFGGLDGYFEYNERTGMRGLSNELNDKKFMITNSSKVYFDKKNQNINIRYIPLITLTIGAWLSNDISIIDTENIYMGYYGSLRFQPMEFMQSISNILNELNFDINIFMNKLGSNFQNIIEYWYNLDPSKYTKLKLIYDDYKHFQKMFIYNPPEYDDYLFVYNNFWNSPYVLDKYTYLVSKQSPNIHETFIDMLTFFDYENYIIDNENYTECTIEAKNFYHIHKYLIAYAAQLFNIYENDYFSDCNNSIELRQKVKEDLLKLS